MDEDEDFEDDDAGADFGFVHPCAVLKLEIDKADGIWVSSEFYETGRTDLEVAEYTAALGVSRVYPDPESPSAIEDMRRKGVNVRPVVKGKDSEKNGIDKVRELLKANKLHVHRSCKGLISEFETHAYKEGTGEPEETDEDALDALRYPIMMMQPHIEIIDDFKEDEPLFSDIGILRVVQLARQFRAPTDQVLEHGDASAHLLRVNHAVQHVIRRRPYVVDLLEIRCAFGHKEKSIFRWKAPNDEMGNQITHGAVVLDVIEPRYLLLFPCLPRPYCFRDFVHIRLGGLSFPDFREHSVAVHNLSSVSEGEINDAVDANDPAEQCVVVVSGPRPTKQVLCAGSIHDIAQINGAFRLE